MLYPFDDLVFCKLITPCKMVIYEDCSKSILKYIKCPTIKDSITFLENQIRVLETIRNLSAYKVCYQTVNLGGKIYVTENAKMFFETGICIANPPTHKLNYCILDNKADPKIKMILLSLGLCEDIITLILQYVNLGGNFKLEPYVFKVGPFNYIKKGFNYILQNECQNANEEFVFRKVVPELIMQNKEWVNGFEANLYILKVKYNERIPIYNIPIEQYTSKLLASVGINPLQFNLEYIIKFWGF